MNRRDEFFLNWHTFGNRMYRYKDGRWIPTTEDIFAVELEKFNAQCKRRRWSLRVFINILAFIAGWFAYDLFITFLKNP